MQSANRALARGLEQRIDGGELGVGTTGPRLAALSHRLGLPIMQVAELVMLAHAHLSRPESLAQAANRYVDRWLATDAAALARVARDDLPHAAQRLRAWTREHPRAAAQMLAQLQRFDPALARSLFDASAAAAPNALSREFAQRAKPAQLIDAGQGGRPSALTRLPDLPAGRAWLAAVVTDASGNARVVMQSAPAGIARADGQDALRASLRRLDPPATAATPVPLRIEVGPQGVLAPQRLDRADPGPDGDWQQALADATDRPVATGSQSAPHVFPQAWTDALRESGFVSTVINGSAQDADTTILAALQALVAREGAQGAAGVVRNLAEQPRGRSGGAFEQAQDRFVRAVLRSLPPGFARNAQAAAHQRMQRDAGLRRDESLVAYELCQAQLRGAQPLQQIRQRLMNNLGERHYLDTEAGLLRKARQHLGVNNVADLAHVFRQMLGEQWLRG